MASQASASVAPQPWDERVEAVQSRKFLMLAMPPLHVPHLPFCGNQPRCMPRFPAWVLESPHMWDAVTKWVLGYCSGHITSTAHPRDAGWCPVAGARPNPFDVDVVNDYDALQRLRKGPVESSLKQFRAESAEALLASAPDSAFSLDLFALHKDPPAGSAIHRDARPINVASMLRDAHKLVPEWPGIKEALARDPMDVSGGNASPPGLTPQQQHGEVQSKQKVGGVHSGGVRPPPGTGPDNLCVQHPEGHGRGPSHGFHTNAACRAQQQQQQQQPTKHAGQLAVKKPKMKQQPVPPALRAQLQKALMTSQDFKNLTGNTKF